MRQETGDRCDTRDYRVEAHPNIKEMQFNRRASYIPQSEVASVGVLAEFVKRIRSGLPPLPVARPWVAMALDCTKRYKNQWFPWVAKPHTTKTNGFLEVLSNTLQKQCDLL